LAGSDHFPLLFLGNFTGPNDLNLILDKVNHVEILSVTPEGLRPVKQFTINGKVDVVKFFRPPVTFILKS
jgi:DNA damage-binding protein 1